MSRAAARSPWLAAFVALGAPLVLVAQEPEDGGDPPTIEELGAQLAPPDPQQAEMLKLFAEVERNLVAIDDLLFEAAAGENDLDLMESGLSELFLSTRDRSSDVAQGIDRILELAQEMESQQQNSGGGGGQSSGQSGGQSPLDDRGPESQRRKEESRTDPGAPETGGDQQGNRQGNQLEERRPESSGAEDGGEQAGSEENREGESPGQDPLGAGSEPGGAGQWGELPPRVQEIFSNQVSDELPLEYRDFIESYWLRLQREG